MQVYDIPIDQHHREQTQHGCFEFPLAIYETCLDKNVLGYVNWHWHEELQFAYMLKGSAEFFVGQSHHILSKGQGIFINSGVLHKITPDSAPDSSYICLDIHPSLLRGFPGSIIDQKYVRPYLQDKNFTQKSFLPENMTESFILNQLKKINELYNTKENGYELSILIYIMETWRALLSLQPQEQTDKPFTEQDNTRIKSILTFIHLHYREKLSLQEIANEVHLCNSECCRFFKQYMHCTIFDYLLDYRIERSIEALLFSPSAISCIAYDYGFGTTSYYISRFRQKIGCTPLEFRKNKQIKQN